MDEYIGVIKIFAGNFAPRGWAFCNGQSLPIQQYAAVYSLLGTTYGGNGTSYFNLPDLRGRAPIHFGQGNGLTNRTIGEVGGTESVTLDSTNMPAHTHNLSVSNANSTNHQPASGNSIAAPMDINGDVAKGFNTSAPNTALSSTTITSTGGSLPHPNMQPYMAVNYIICLEGIYPSRN